MRPTRPPDCQAGDDALRRGAWNDARQAFEDAVRLRESPAALEGLGTAAWWLDLADLVFESRERAYTLYLGEGDHLGAARVAVWLAWDYWAFRGEGAVASGWLQRARRLLEGRTACSERAWVELREASMSLFEEGDAERAYAMAAEGIRIAREAADHDLEMLGLAVQGLALVTSGSVADGMRHLDEVNTAVIAGEMTDLVAIGLSCCYLIAACERVRDYDRALQWCTRLKAFCAKWGFRPLFAVCRTQYASLCVWRGTWEEAEDELRAASDELAASRPAMTGDALVRLAELRRRQGRLADAATLLDQVEPRGLALLGWAELAFDRGDLQTAAEQAARYLRHVPAHNRTDRAAGLDVLVRALADLGEWERAKASLAELSGIAERLGTTPLRAFDSFARGYMAVRDGQPDAARQHFEDAVDHFLRSGAPFEVARARLELAGALHRLGRADAALDEAKLATKIFTELKAEHAAARARNVLETLAAAGTGGAREKTGAAHDSLLTRREVEVLRLVAEGLSNQTIATRLFVSDHTVHRHVANILNKFSVSTRAAAVAQAARRGLLT